MPDRLEERHAAERGARDRELGAASDRMEERLQRDDEPEEREREPARRDPVHEGAVDEEIDVVEVVAEDRHRGRGCDDDRRAAHDVGRRGDRHAKADDHRERRDRERAAVEEPLDLLSLHAGRAPVADEQRLDLALL